MKYILPTLVVVFFMLLITYFTLNVLWFALLVVLPTLSSFFK